MLTAATVYVALELNRLCQQWGTSEWPWFNSFTADVAAYKVTGLGQITVTYVAQLTVTALNVCQLLDHSCIMFLCVCYPCSF